MPVTSGAPSDEAIRTARRRAVFLATFPSALAICFGLDNGPCAPIRTVIFAIPILFALFLPAADIVATLARGTPRFTIPTLSSYYRVAVVGLPIVCFGIARALADPVASTGCMLP